MFECHFRCGTFPPDPLARLRGLVTWASLRERMSLMLRATRPGLGTLRDAWHSLG